MKNLQFVYQMPAKIVFGLPFLKVLNEEITQFGSKPLIVTGRNFVFKTGIIDKINQVYKSNGFRTAIFSEVGSDPSFDIVSKGVELARKEKIDFIMAIGGGSVLDVAKLIAASYNNPGVNLISHTDEGKVQSCMWKGKKESLNFIAIPTTAGSGSEVSKASVITDRKYRIKCSIKSPFFYPTLAIIDPVLTTTLPNDQTAFTGMDALTHLTEAYLSLGANPLTDTLAIEGIKIVIDNLLIVIQDPKNIQARENMMIASMYGGIVDSNAGLGIDHILAHIIGVWYGIPHGLACAIFLPHAIECNFDAQKSKIKNLSKIFGGDNVVQAVKLLIKKLQIPSSLSEVNIPKADLQKIAEKACENKAALAFNPKLLTANDINKILERAY